MREKEGRRARVREKEEEERERKGDTHAEKLCEHVDIEDMKVRRAQNNFNYKIP